MANPKVVSGPGTEPATITEAKTQTRVDYSTDDTYLTSLITVAREKVEKFLGRKLINTTLDYFLNRFPDEDFIELPLAGPLVSITSLKYTDSDGTETTWDAGNYFAATARDPGALVLAYNKVWPSVILKPAEAIVIRYVAGYGTSASDVPTNFKQAILATIDYHYHFRGGETPAPGEAMSKSGIPPRFEGLLWDKRLLAV